MVILPTPAKEGVNNPFSEFTPGPEYVPFSGIPPLSLNGLALRVVIVSKQAMKETTGISLVESVIELLVAGFPVMHELKDVPNKQETTSPFAGG